MSSVNAQVSSHQSVAPKLAAQCPFHFVGHRDLRVQVIRGRAGGLEVVADVRVREAKVLCLKPEPGEASGQVDAKG